VIETSEDVFQSGGQGTDMPDLDSRNAIAGGACAVHSLADRSLCRTPADEEEVPFGWAIDLRSRETLCQRLKFLSATGHHWHVKLWRAGRMAHFIVLEAGGNWIFAAHDACARSDVMSDAIRRVQIIGLVIEHGRKVG